MANSKIYSFKSRGHLRLMLTFCIPLVIFVSLYLFVILPSLRNDIYNEKMTQTSEMVEIGLSVLEHFHSLERQGILKRTEAQKEASELIRNLGYGERDLDYYWINDFNAFMVVHPFRPDLEGKVMTNSDDPEDQHLYNLFRQFVEVGRKNGGGHVAYSWQYYDETERFEEKLSYVASFEPWGWIIGTGVYLTDMEMIIAGRRNVAAAVMAFLFAVSAALILFFYKSRVTERELLENEEKYRLIADNTADVISIIDLDMRYIYISPSIEKMKGFTPEEAASKNLEHILTPDSLGKSLDLYCRQMALEEKGMGDPSRSFHLLLEEYCKDGSTIWVENSLSFIRDSLDKPIGILSVSRDVTERIKQQEQIQMEQREKTVILENLAELVTYVDLKMSIIWANPAVSQAHEKSPEQYLGKKCYEIWHDTAEPCPGCPVREALNTGAVCRSVITYPDGRSWRMTGSPVFGEDGEIIGALDTALDITDLKLAEDRLKLLNEELEHRVRERTAELEQANKELAAFTYSVSHDLRAPLRSIIGFSEAILEDHVGQLDEQGRDYIRRVAAASLRMSELIDDLLKLSRVTRQELHRDQVDLSAIMEASLRHLQERDLHRNAEIKITSGLTAPGDAALLRIALDNLADNAWKYTAAVNTARIEFGREQVNEEAVFYIRDNGVGFDMAYAEQIFEAFQRLHSFHDYPGTGIGLSIVSRIIERHSGTIRAEARPGSGAVFYFSLPE